MKQFTIVFTTRHRNEYAVDRDCVLISECIVKYTIEYKCIYNGNGVIVFHVYGVGKKARIEMLDTILGRMRSLTYFKSIDLQSYTHE